MGTFRKIPDRFKVNKKGVKLFEPTYDERVRKKEGLWIKHRKRTYLYWYKFLQLCLYKKLTIKKDKYRGWHLDTILDTRFDDWWENHWRELFATKTKGAEPKVKLSTTKIKYESIRYSYFVACLSENVLPYKNCKFHPVKHPYSNVQIAYHIFKYELQTRYPTRENGYLRYPTGFAVH